MSNYTWTIEHSSDGGSTLTDITSLCQRWTYRYGRRAVTDQWSTGTGTVDGLDPASLPTISVGDYIVFSEAGYGIQFVLAVADFTWSYNPAATADRWTITLEDAYAQVGRIYLNSDATINAGSDCGTIVYGLATFYSPLVMTKYGGFSKLSAFTLNKGTNGTQVFQTLTSQAGAYMQTQNVAGGTIWVGYESLPCNGDPDNLFTTILFSDVAGQVPYTEIQFEGLADSYFDIVYVKPAGLAAQSSGSGSRQYALDTYDQTTAQAQTWADYLLIQLGSATQTPSTISTISDAVEPVFYMPGNSVEITLRGSTYYATIEGGVITATPAQTRITLNLSDREATNFLILDDTVWGKLDENRLGF